MINTNSLLELDGQRVILTRYWAVQLKMVTAVRYLYFVKILKRVCSLNCVTQLFNFEFSHFFCCVTYILQEFSVSSASVLPSPPLVHALNLGYPINCFSISPPTSRYQNMLVKQWVMVWEAWAQFPPDSEVSALSPCAD